MARKIYAVMGATGNIGHVLAQELLKGNQVRAIGRNPKKLEALKAKGAEIVVIKDFDDAKALAKAFQGADAIFSFIPPSMDAPDYIAYQDKVSEAICSALQSSKVVNVLNLSSIGANLTNGIGPIAGLARHEKRLAKLTGVNVLNLRPGYFMENLMNLAPGIKQEGVLASPLRGDIQLPMVATSDIGRKAAELLTRLDFKGQTVFDFAGPKNATLDGAARVIGKEIGKPGLKYVQLPPNKAEQIMLASGMKPDLIKLILEMENSFNEGRIAFTQKITGDHQGRTTLEEFARSFAQAYHGGLAHV